MQTVSNTVEHSSCDTGVHTSSNTEVHLFSWIRGSVRVRASWTATSYLLDLRHLLLYISADVLVVCSALLLLFIIIIIIIIRFNVLHLLTVTGNCTVVHLFSCTVLHSVVLTGLSLVTEITLHSLSGTCRMMVVIKIMMMMMSSIIMVMMTQVYLCALLLRHSLGLSHILGLHHILALRAHKDDIRSRPKN